MKKSCALSVISLILFLSIPASQVFAQEFKRFEDITSTGTSYHIFAKQGEATIQVLFLGSIGAAGVYEIGVETELDQLIALTGGAPSATTNTAEVETTIRILRKEGTRRELIYEASIEQMMSQPGLYPPLQDGDVITVESITTQKTPFTWRDGLSLVSSLSSVVVLIRLFTN